MQINITKLADSISKVSQDFKTIYNLDYDSHNLLYGVKIFESDNMNADTNDSFELSLFLTRFKDHIRKLNIMTDSLVDAYIDNLFRYLTQHINILSAYYYSDVKYAINKYCCDNPFIEVDNPAKWIDCPKCGLKPLIWKYGNIAKTSCGCGSNRFDHFSLSIETDSLDNDVESALLIKWNDWCETD